MWQGRYYPSGGCSLERIHLSPEPALDRDRVDFVVGPIFSNILQAIHKPVMDAGTILISTNAGTSSFAGHECNPNFFVTSYQNDQIFETLGTVAQSRGYKRVYVLVPNYQAGKDAIAGFKHAYKGQIVEESLVPLKSLDFQAELTKIHTLKPDALFTFMPGLKPILIRPATVLLAFIAIGLFDSLHFRLQLDGKPGQKASYAVEVLSVLDVLAAPLRTRNEKTYSEPFATRLYAKETIDLPGGETVRGYPRLKHGGSHLGEREGDVAADAGLTAFRVGVLALLGWLALAAGASALVARSAPVAVDAENERKLLAVAIGAATASAPDSATVAE